MGDVGVSCYNVTTSPSYATLLSNKLPEERSFMQSPKYDGQIPGFQCLRCQEYRLSHLKYLLVIKEVPKTEKKILKGKENTCSPHPHGMTNCQGTMEWGEKETECAFHLAAGSGATPGGYFKISI